MKLEPRGTGVAVGENQQTSTKPSVGKDTLWLVKSGDRVLGPFSSMEIIRRLRAKELVVIDEVISPMSRWRHIRDESVFASVVDEIRTGLMTVRDDTEVGTDRGGESAKTETITLRAGDDKTPRPGTHATNSVGSATAARFDSSMNASRIMDAEIVDEVDDDGEIIHHASAREIEAPSRKKSKVHSSLSYAPPDRNGQRAKVKDASAIVSKTSKALWALVAMAVLVLGASFYFFRIAPAKRALVRADEVARIRKEADRAWTQAEFLRAMKLYEQISREPRADADKNLEADLRHAILQLRVARETLAAKRRLEELIPKLATSEAKNRARIALAVASLQADEPVEAQNALLKIVKEPDAGPIAFFNLGAAQAANGLRSEAIETLTKLDNHPTLGAPARLLRAMLHMKIGAMKMASASTDVDDQGRQPAFRQELYAVAAVADGLDGNKKRSAQRLRIALDSDPFQTEEFFFDPLVYLEAVRWRQILPYAKEFSAKTKTNSAKALYALALVKSDRRSDAQQVLSESLSPKVNDPDLQAVSAYSLMMQGRDEEARGALKFTRANGNSVVPMLAAVLDARIYERASDRNAADAVWMEVAKRADPPVAALVSVARVDSQIVTEKIIGAVERLKVLYPNSIQVLKLHEGVFSSGAESAAPGSSAKP